MTDHNQQAYDFAMQLTRSAINSAPVKPIDTIRASLGMRDHAAEAMRHLEDADKQTNDGLETKALTRSLIHSNLAAVEELRRNRHLADWAGMEGNES